MAAKKRKKKVVRRHSPPVKKVVKSEKEPEYMIQLSDPKMLRKDILESLREVIIFMQGYEDFRKIQDQKVEMFSKLKEDVKDLQSMINNTLRKYLPKGKLRAVAGNEKVEDDEEEMEMAEGVSVVDIKKEKPKPVQTWSAPSPRNELDELEKQLQDIEGQLQTMK